MVQNVWYSSLCTDSITLTLSLFGRHSQVLEKLDGEGCARVAAVLRDLPHDSVLVVGQASSYVTEAFQVMDVVVKTGGRASIELAA